MEHVFAHRFW